MLLSSTTTKGYYGCCTSLYSPIGTGQKDKYKSGPSAELIYLHLIIYHSWFKYYCSILTQCRLGEINLLVTSHFDDNHIFFSWQCCGPTWSGNLMAQKSSERESWVILMWYKVRDDQPRQQIQSTLESTGHMFNLWTILQSLFSRTLSVILKMIK